MGDSPAGRLQAGIWMEKQLYFACMAGPAVQAVVVGCQRPGAGAAPDLPPAGAAAAGGRPASRSGGLSTLPSAIPAPPGPTSSPPVARWSTAGPHWPFSRPLFIAALARPRAVPAVSGPCVRVARGAHRRNPARERAGGRARRPRGLPIDSIAVRIAATRRHGSQGGARRCEGGRLLLSRDLQADWQC